MLGTLVSFKPHANREEATDFRVQTYQGRPVLTWWQGRLVGGEGRGEGVIYDQHYRPVRRVRAGNGFSADLHEFELTPQGTALLLSYDRVKMDLRAYGGSRDGTVVDGVVQEVDIATGLVLFEWHSVGHVSPKDSMAPAPKGSEAWDYMHLNSVALDGDGDFVVSARRASTVLKIDRATGRIVWRMGGKSSTLKMGPGTSFHLQHDARPHPDGTITLFDNASPPAFRKASRAVTIRVDARPEPRRWWVRSRIPTGCCRPRREASSRFPTATRSSDPARSAGSPSTTQPGTPCSMATSRRAMTPIARSGSRGRECRPRTRASSPTSGPAPA